MKSQFTKTFDAIIASGLISQWEKDLQRRPNKTMQTYEDRPISMSELGVIVAYLSLIMLASVGVFIAEIVINYQNQPERRVGRNFYVNLFWDLLDKFICGKRLFFLLGQSNFLTDFISMCFNWVRNKIAYRVAKIRSLVERFHRAVIVPGIYASVVIFALLNVGGIVVWIVMKYYF